MTTNFKFPDRAYSLVEIVLAIVLFGLVSLAIWRLGGTSRRFDTEVTSMTQQNAYSTLRAQIALQGLNPTMVTNLAAPVLTDSGGKPVTPINPATDQRNMGFVRSLVASFESTAIKTARGANRVQVGSAPRIAINYQTPSLSMQTSKGIGFGYRIGSTGTTVPPSSLPLNSPTFNYSGDLTSVPFPLNGIIDYPSNPPGTTYHYTTDGSPPTAASPNWNNNPGWTISSFPQTLAIVAFNTDLQYSPSSPATTNYSYTLSAANFSRADGRSKLYDFYYSDLQSPSDTGIVLTTPVAGAAIIYTTDGSTPSITNGTLYTGPFPPDPLLFNPTVSLNIIVTSGDPRYVSSPVSSYTLNPIQVPLTDPVVATDNSQPLPTGTLIGFGYSDPTSYSDPSIWLTTDSNLPGSTTDPLGADLAVFLN